MNTTTKNTMLTQALSAMQMLTIARAAAKKVTDAARIADQQKRASQAQAAAALRRMQ